MIFKQARASGELARRLVAERGYPDVRTAHLYEAGLSSAYGPQVVAAIMAGALTVIGALAAQYFGRRATSRDTERHSLSKASS